MMNDKTESIEELIVRFQMMNDETPPESIEELIERFQKSYYSDGPELSDTDFAQLWDYLKNNAFNVKQIAVEALSKNNVSKEAISIKFWDNIDHNAPDQRKRQRWAKDESRITIISINKEQKTGVFQGTSWGEYETSTESCTCQDFEQRKLPCKHIYRLAYELGVIEPPEFKRGGHRIPKADKETTGKELGIFPGTIFHISYKGSKGDISERDIEIQKLAYVGDKLYVYAYCHLRHTVRSFLASGITSMTYEGREINNFHDFFNIRSNIVENLVKQALEAE